jgi:two-component system, LuxR family, response regulator DctR
MKGLSNRERVVMDLLLAGKKNKVIAEDLGISKRTVEVHRSRIFEKIHVRNAVELANLIASLS